MPWTKPAPCFFLIVTIRRWRKGKGVPQGFCYSNSHWPCTLHFDCFSSLFPHNTVGRTCWTWIWAQNLSLNVLYSQALCLTMIRCPYQGIHISWQERLNEIPPLPLPGGCGMSLNPWLVSSSLDMSAILFWEANYAQRLSSSLPAIYLTLT